MICINATTIHTVPQQMHTVHSALRITYGVAGIKQGLR